MDEGWQFFPDPSAKITVSELDKLESWRPARVGLSWNVQFEDLRDYMGAAEYAQSENFQPRIQWMTNAAATQQ